MWCRPGSLSFVKAYGRIFVVCWNTRRRFYVMKTIKTTGARSAIMAGLLSLALVGCGAGAGSGSSSANASSASNQAASSALSVSSAASTASGDSILNTADLFTDRDMQQTADTSSATKISVQDNTNVTIDKEGVYVLSGSASNVTINVTADDTAKVQLVLDGLTIQNTNTPAICVTSADKVFVTTAKGSTNKLTVTDAFATDEQTKADAVVFSKDDLVLNGEGSLEISSSQNGVSSHDDLKVTGGTYVINSQEDALEANDNVLVAGGAITITSQKDGIHAENDEDNTTGNVYISNANLTIDAKGDGIQATAALQIDSGVLAVTAAEGLEATYIQVNDGNINVTATDDGINGSNKSTAYTPTIEIRGGNLVVEMGQGDTDALDVNGNLYISGGTVDISAQSAFDYDGEGSLTGGTVYVNGEQVDTLQNSMMGGGQGGGMMGGHGGGMMGQQGGDMQGGMPGGRDGGMQGSMQG